jgi:hypothetical protein
MSGRSLSATTADAWVKAFGRGEPTASLKEAKPIIKTNSARPSHTVRITTRPKCASNQRDHFAYIKASFVSPSSADWASPDDLLLVSPPMRLQGTLGGTHQQLRNACEPAGSGGRGFRFRKKLFEFAGGHGRTEQVSLHLTAAQLLSLFRCSSVSTRSAVVTIWRAVAIATTA